MEHKNNFLCERRFLAAITALLLFCVINTASAQTVLPAEDIAEKALAATVYLEMKDKSGKTLGIGSGFFVKPNLIATNYHVIEGAASGTAKLIGKYTTYNIEGITATDRTNNLALLKVTAYGIEPLPLGDSVNVNIGATVHVIGSLKGMERTFSDGIVSAINPEEDIQKWIHIIGASISSRSNGAPVLDSKWNVIGVFVSTPTGRLSLGAKNFDHAVPVNVLKALLKQSGTVTPFSQRQQPISAETYYQWGYTKYELGDYRSAIANYDMVIRLKPDYALAYYNRGVAKEMLRQYFVATVDYNTANNLEPNAATFSNSMGGFAASLGNYNGAISDFDMAIRLKPDYAEAYYNRGKAKFNLEKYFDAISDFDMAIRLKSDYAEAYEYRGLAKSNLGQHAVAITDFDTAIRLNPDYVKAYKSRGLAKCNLKQYASAIIDFDKAIQLNPSYALAYLNRGFAKSNLGQHFAAISDYDTVIRLRPDYARAYILRGSVKGILGHTAEAKQDFQTALKLAEKAGDVRLKAQIVETLRLME